MQVADRLFDWYRDTVGEPDHESDLYIGFTLFFIGTGLALLGLGVFVWSEFAATQLFKYTLREIAFSAGAIALPVALGGVIVLLPGDRRAVGVGGIGLAVCLVAVGYFSVHYPYEWNVPSEDYALHGMLIYAIGLVTVVATTATALINYHIERFAPTDDETPSDTEQISDEQIEQDIDEATENSTLTWGGVYRDDDPDINLTADSAENGFTGTLEGTTVRVEETVDENVADLQAMKGGTKETTTADSTADQAAALAELREKQQTGDAPTPGRPHIVIRVYRRLVNWATGVEERVSTPNTSPYATQSDETADSPDTPDAPDATTDDDADIARERGQS